MPNLLLQSLKTAPAAGTRPSGASALQWYKLNETVSPGINSGVGAGSGLVGYGGTTWAQPLSTLSWANKSVQLNNSNTDYLANAAGADVLAGAGAYTIEFWTYLTGNLSFAFGSNPYMASHNSQVTYNDQWVIFWINGNAVRIRNYNYAFPFGNQAAIADYTVSYASQVQNQICYWVFTKQNAGSYPVCYLNGVALTAANSGIPGTLIADATAQTTIGPNGPNPYAQSIVGQYSNFIVDNTFTSSATALARYNAAFP